MISHNAQTDKLITIIITHQNKEPQLIQMKIQAIHFCNFFDQEIVNQQSEQTNLVFKFSSELDITIKNIQLIITFMQMHNYDPKQVEQNKKPTLKINNEAGNSILHPTTKFVQQYLEDISKADLWKLKKTCNFFQIHTLKKVINLFLVSKYDPGMNDTKVKEQLIKLNLQNFSREDFNNLKSKYFDFFQNFGKKIAEQHLGQQQSSDQEEA